MQEIVSLLFIKCKRAIDTMKFLFWGIEKPGHKIKWLILGYSTYIFSGVLIKAFAV
jgi:hypothetical protein